MGLCGEMKAIGCGKSSAYFHVHDDVGGDGGDGLE